MHIPDGIFNPINPATHALNVSDIAVLGATWAVTVPCLIYAWRKTKSQNSSGLASMLAVMSALVFVAQMLSFPVAGGTTVHVLGGTLLALVLGPFPAMLSMTLVLGMQAVFFADGGFLAFGANALNMAVVGGLTFFFVRLLMWKSADAKRFATAVFVATLGSAVFTALLTGVEIGFSSAFVGGGGIAVTVPAMLSVYVVEGVVEASVTALVCSALWMSRLQVVGLKLIRGGEKLW